MPIYMRYEGVDGVADSSWGQGQVSLPQHTDGGLATDYFSWGLDRVDRAAPASSFDSGFLGETFVQASAGDPDVIDGIIVGASVNGHVKSIDAAAGGGGMGKVHYSDLSVMASDGINALLGDGSVRDIETIDIGGTGGDDVLIGGATSHDGGAINHFSWGLDRVDQAAPASFDSSFLGGIFVPTSTSDPDRFDDIIVGTGVPPHVKSIDVGAGGGGKAVISDISSWASDDINALLGDGSVRHVRSDAEPFFAYDPGALGGVWKAGDNIDLDAIIAAGDHHDPHFDQGFIGGVSVAVADVELPILMHAKFMF